MSFRPLVFASTVTVTAWLSYAYVPVGTTVLDSKAYETYHEDPFLPNQRIDCAADDFVATNFMWRLPSGMPDVMGASSIGWHWGGFNPGDVIDNDSGPSRRFAMAAIGQHQVIAAVERGGMAYGVEIWSFERTGLFRWSGWQTHVMNAHVPASTADLVAQVCKPH